MSQTLQNGITVPTNPDAFTNLANDLATMGNTANVVIKVANQAGRDALTGKYLGMVVSRADLGGLLEVFDGTNWQSPNKIKHAEWKNNGAFAVTGNAAWDIGALTIQANTTNNTFSNATGTLSGQVNITESGLYALNLRIAPTSDPGNSNAKLVGPSSVIYAENVNPSGGSGNGLWEWDVHKPNQWLNAGDTVRGTLKTTNSCSIAAYLSISKLQG
jgi:hypothetical protein